MRADPNPSGWLERLGLTETSTGTALVTPTGSLGRADLCRSVLAVAEALHPLAPGQVAQLYFQRGDPRALVAALAVWERGAIPLFQDAAGSSERADAAAMSVGAVVRVKSQGGADERLTVVGSSTLSVRALEPVTPVDLGSDDPGYLVQTSGSSGSPRTSFNTSSGLRNAVDGLVERYCLTDGSRALQFAPFGYDAWLADALPALRAGGSLVYGPLAAWSGLRVVERVVAEFGATHAVLPPSVWRRLQPVTRLDVAVSAGEALDVRTASAVREAATRVINAYGPSEAAVCAMTYELSGSEVRIPLGDPLPGVEVSAVADCTGRTILRIGGVGVAYGYVGGPDWAEDEAADGSGFFGMSKHGRFFQTSDVVEVSGGATYFVGRVDRSIKRRGRLVSLERVEAAVRALPGVTDCVAWTADERIVCEVVGGDRDPEVSRALLGAALEPWEIPSELRPAQDLRRSASDKLDLRPWSASKQALDQRVRAIWKRVVGSDDEALSYFALGGDSLGAMELLDQVALEVGVEVDIADFVADPTLAELSRLVARRGKSA